jgi:hypothetical protein
VKYAREGEEDQLVQWALDQHYDSHMEAAVEIASHLRQVVRKYSHCSLFMSDCVGYLLSCFTNDCMFAAYWDKFSLSNTSLNVNLSAISH